MIKSKLKNNKLIIKFYNLFLNKKEKRLLFKKLKKEFICFYDSLNVQQGTVLLIGVPTHPNIGDCAIAIAEKMFLIEAGIKTENIVEITLTEFNKYKSFLIKKISRSRCLVCLLGGGNMGNEWLCEELPRREMVKGFSKNQIIVFPQTVFYANDENGRAESEKSISVYNNRSNLTLVAREKTSFNIMKSLYPKTEILITPDIVLYTTPELYTVNRQDRKGVLLVMRNDVESAMKSDDLETINKHIAKKEINCRITDMYSFASITKENREQIVSDKMKEFAQSELVITDRLHGMVFAAITETPCIVFSNYNHKVKGTYEWIRYLPYIKYVESVDEAIKLIPEMLKMNNCKFDNKPLMPYFNKLREIIRAYV